MQERTCCSVVRGKRPTGAFSDPSNPYSPDLNPIEMVFAKLKTLFRKADERTIDASWRRAGNLLDTFTPDECQNYLKHAGYASA
jgi:transposase